MRVSVHRPRPSVSHDQSRETFRPLQHGRQSDRPSPVLCDQGDITQVEVIHELACYNGAYVHYLLSVYVPLALARDPTFGLAIDTLAAAIRQRLSHRVGGRLHQGAMEGCGDR